MFVNLDIVVTTPSGAPVVGATVLIGRDYGNGTQRTTDGGGFANFGVEQDDLDWEVAADGYTPAIGNVAVGFADVRLPVTLAPIAVAAPPPPAPPAPAPPPVAAPPPAPAPAYANLNITVTDLTTGAALGGATVLISPDFGNGTTRTTDGAGFANFGVRFPAAVEINIGKPGYVNNDHVLQVTDGGDHWYAIALGRGSAPPPPSPPPGVPPEVVLTPGTIGELTPVPSTAGDDVTPRGYPPVSFETRDGVPSFTAQSFGALEVPALGVSPVGIFVSIVSGLLGLFKGASGSSDVAHLSTVVTNVGQLLLQTVQTVADLAARSVHTDTQAGGLFDHILGGVLGPIINALASVIRGGATDLGKLFGPISDSIKKLVGAVRKIYDTWLRPILHAIDVARQLLRVLESFHLKWATEADAALGRLEGKLSAPLLLAIRKLNEVSGVVNRIVTLDGALQRVTLLKSMVKHQTCVQRAIDQAPMAAAGTYPDTVAALERSGTQSQLQANLQLLADDEDGPWSAGYESFVQRLNEDSAA